MDKIIRVSRYKSYKQKARQTKHENTRPLECCAICFQNNRLSAETRCTDMVRIGMQELLG